jgi:nucleotide-binding universal stress UspA family protein
MERAQAGAVKRMTINFLLCRFHMELKRATNQHTSELTTFEGESSFMYKKILIALEGKSTNQAAIVHATALALESSTHVALLQVIQLAQTSGDGLRALQLEPGAWAWRRKNEAETRLTQLEGQLRNQGVDVDTNLVLGERDAADEIVDFAAQAWADLLVMAADGRAWWRPLISGCLADSVHRKASIPILFVSDGTRRAPIVARQVPAPDSALAGFDHIHP